MFLETSKRKDGAVRGEGEAHPVSVWSKWVGFKTDYLDIAVFDIIPDIRKLAVVNLDIVLLQRDPAPADGHASLGNGYHQPGSRQ